MESFEKPEVEFVELDDTVDTMNTSSQDNNPPY